MEVTCEAMRSVMDPLLYEVAKKINGGEVSEKVRPVTAPCPTSLASVKNSCVSRALFAYREKLVGRIVYMYNSADASLFHCDNDVVRRHPPAEAGPRQRTLGIRPPAEAGGDRGGARRQPRAGARGAVPAAGRRPPAD